MISLVPSPSPASNTIRARRASPARIDGERTHEASTSWSRGGTLHGHSQRHKPWSANENQTSRYLAHGTRMFEQRGAMLPAAVRCQEGGGVQSCWTMTRSLMTLLAWSRM
jgi:hypothetical protein